MKSTVRILATGLVSALALAASTFPAAAAVEPQFAYGGSAGGTKVTAVGTVVSSSATAQSTLFGFTPGQDTNKVATVDAAPLATAGAVTTDVTATAIDDGFTIKSHARVANVSLLNGLIKAQAVDTTSTASSSHGTATTGDTTSQLVGLVIAGKQYPINVAQNTAINIPGVASVTINASNTAVDGRTVMSFGGALVVTLLSQQNGIAAGAEIVVNPTWSLIQPKPASSAGPSLGGMGYGAYAYSHVGDAVKAETGRIGGVGMPLGGTNGETMNNHLANVNLNALLNASAVDTDVTGISTPNYAKSTVVNKLANLNLFNQFLFGGLITATAIGTTAEVEMQDDQWTMDGSLQFVNLRIAGQAIPVNVAPNTKIHVANLGTVTINEQSQVAVNGFVHGFQVIGLHIVLDTAAYGLPVGAEVEIGVSQALVWR